MHLAGKCTKMAEFPASNVQVAGRSFAKGAHGAPSEEGASLVVPGIDRVVHSVVNRASQAPQNHEDEDG